MIQGQTITGGRIQVLMVGDLICTLRLWNLKTFRLCPQPCHGWKTANQSAHSESFSLPLVEGKEQELCRHAYECVLKGK